MVFKIKLLDKIKSLKEGFMLTEKQKKWALKQTGKNLVITLWNLVLAGKLKKQIAMDSFEYWLNQKGYKLYENFGWHRQEIEKYIKKSGNKWCITDPVGLDNYFEQSKLANIASIKQTDQLQGLVGQIFN